MKTLLLLSALLLSWNVGTELEQKTYTLDKPIKNLKIEGFDDIYFEFADSNEVVIQYPKVSSGSHKLSVKQHNRDFSIRIIQKQQDQPKTIWIKGDLEEIKTVDITGRCNVHFPYGWEGQTLRRWQNHNQAEFFYDRNDTK